jgi:hypothetical protein
MTQEVKVREASGVSGGMRRMLEPTNLEYQAHEKRTQEWKNPYLSVIFQATHLPQVDKC